VKVKELVGLQLWNRCDYQIAVFASDFCVPAKHSVIATFGEETMRGILVSP
jgi:hypothetical protein